eukprot:Hpha_TRINITY_DN9620_c0_g1::TRINITY_DN9620_c0_g1_i1::g.184361::m.184361
MSLLVFARAPGLDPVAVEVGADGTVGDLLAECRKIAGMAHVSEVSFGGHMLAPGTALADTGLSSQSVVDLVSNPLANSKLVRIGTVLCKSDDIALSVEEGHAWTVCIDKHRKRGGVSSYHGLCRADTEIRYGVAHWRVTVKELHSGVGDNFVAGVFVEYPNSPLDVVPASCKAIMGEKVRGEDKKCKVKVGQSLDFVYDAFESTLKCTSTARGFAHTWEGVTAPVWPMVGVTYPECKLLVEFFCS